MVRPSRVGSLQTVQGSEVSTLPHTEQVRDALDRDRHRRGERLEQQTPSS